MSLRLNQYQTFSEIEDIHPKLDPYFKPLHDLEMQILQHSGLKLGEEIRIFDVYLNDSEKNFIHTIECGRNDKPVLLLIHGYAGSAIWFYQMFKRLSKDFKVYAIDFIGMGASSRCKFETSDAKETIEFIADKIDLWREAMNIKQMHIMGHSLGGAMLGYYAKKHP